MKEVTQAKINEWKKAHGDIFHIEVEDNEYGKKSCYVRSPKRNELTAASVMSNNGKDAMKFSEVLLNNCWLDGDEEIKSVDRLFLAAAGKLDQIIVIAEASIKKL